MSSRLSKSTCHQARAKWKQSLVLNVRYIQYSIPTLPNFWHRQQNKTFYMHSLAYSSQRSHTLNARAHIWISITLAFYRPNQQVSVAMTTTHPILNWPSTIWQARVSAGSFNPPSYNPDVPVFAAKFVMTKVWSAKMICIASPACTQVRGSLQEKSHISLR